MRYDACYLNRAVTSVARRDLVDIASSVSHDHHVSQAKRVEDGFGSKMLKG